jgi:L-iditol 2-dehydrogenase
MPLMRIAELTAPRQFRLGEAPVPVPGPGEVLAQVYTVGVCGSDLHYYADGAVGNIPCVYPQVIGHEPAGVVVATGPGVTGWRPGDRAVLEPAVYCYHCEFCLSGHHNLCRHLRFLSMPPDPGFLRQFVALPVANLLPIPAELDFPTATLFEPLAVVLNSMRFIAPHPGETAAVFGAGPIGLLTIALLKLAGVSRVWAIEPVAARRDLALQMGADAALDPQVIDPARQILSDTGQRGVDAAVDCAAKGNTINQCVAVARRAGRVVITGIPVEVQVALDFHVMRYKELAFYTVRRSNHDSELALRLLREHPARFAPVLTHTRPFDQIATAFDMLEHYRDGVGKLVIEIPR